MLTIDGARALLTVPLGRRAAEELVLGSSSTGCASDLERATAVAWSMHFRWGLGERLQVVPHDPGTTHSIPIEEELRAAAAKAAYILRSRRAAFDQLKEALLARGTLEGHEVVEMLAGAPSANGAEPSAAVHGEALRPREIRSSARSQAGGFPAPDRRDALRRLFPSRGSEG